jgi:1,4-alpha-glucan branching enzyme
MHNSHVSLQSEVPTTRFGRVGRETIEAFKPKASPTSAAEKLDSQPTAQPISERFPALEEQDITLTFFAEAAKEVKVAGNFNSWHPDATPMKSMGAGEWVVHLMLRSGQYEYRFVVDGQLSEDPRASQRMASPQGGFNSVLLVPLEVRTSIL